MSAYSYVTIWCGEYVEGDTAGDARKIAKSQGWKVSVADGSGKSRDYCRYHAHMIAQESEAAQ